MAKCKFNKLGVMIDCSRNSVMTVDALKKVMNILSEMGYNTIQLYTEDTFEVTDEPYFGYLRGRYSKDELKEIDKYATSLNMELIPCVQTLAHLSHIFRWQPYWGINDTQDILLTDNQRTYELIENIFKTLSECFTSRNVNIGMDEAHLIGLGKYLEINGYKNRVDILLSHLEKVLKIAEKYGFKCMMWADMFFKLAFGGEYYIKEEKDMPKQILNKVPQNLSLIYWDYYSDKSDQYRIMSKCFKKFNNNIVFASGAWSWVGLVPFNRFGIASNEAAIGEIINAGIKEMFVTAWGDDGGTASIYSVLPTLFYVSMLAKGVSDKERIKKAFKKQFKISFDDYMMVDALNIVKENSDNAVKNPSKYLLYNDALLGAFDSTINDDLEEKYKSYLPKLKKLSKNKNFGFVFQPLYSLNKVLINKACLGLKIRSAYESNSKAELSNLVKNVINPLLKDLNKFLQDLEIYWNCLYKENGFEVIDFRIGGLINRILHIKRIILNYVNGKSSEIKLLNENLLDYLGGVNDLKKEPISYNEFASTATVAKL